MRLWGGRFGDGPDSRMADFTRSIDVDAELALDDIAGSIAHVRGLARAGLLTAEEAEALERGLAGLREDVAAGAIAWDPALEDVHLNLEMLLTERVGAVGGKLHTGRSRNDQVATDLRLWARRAVGQLDVGMLDLERALVDLADREGDAVGVDAVGLALAVEAERGQDGDDAVVEQLLEHLDVHGRGERRVAPDTDHAHRPVREAERVDRLGQGTDGDRLAAARAQLVRAVGHQRGLEVVEELSWPVRRLIGRDDRELGHAVTRLVIRSPFAPPRGRPGCVR